MTDALSAADISHYHREGYVLMRGLLDPADCTTWREAALRACQPTAGAAWSPVIFDHDAPDRQPGVHGALVDDRVLVAVEQLLGAGAQVWYGMAAIVPAGGGRGLAWHQDNQYTHVLGHALNTFIACCRIPPEKCNLWVAPGSHLTGLQPSLTSEGHRQAADPGNGILLPTLEPGDACIFNRYTLHRSLRNDTGETRWAYAAQYHEDRARMAGSWRHDPLRMRARDLAGWWAGLGG